MHKKFILLFVLSVFPCRLFCNFFTSYDGTKIYFIEQKSDATKKTRKKTSVAKDVNPVNKTGTIIFLQGRNEFVEKYQHFYDYLLKNGFDVYAMDLRGQGKSGGMRCHVDSYEQYVNDFSFFIDLVREKIGTAQKINIVSHSTGGLITLKYLIENEVSQKNIGSVILSSPFLGVYHKYFPSGLIRLFTKINIMIGNSKKGISNYSVNEPFEKNIVTHDKVLYNRFLNDPLKCGKPSYGWLEQSMKTINDVNTPGDFTKIKVPVKILVSKTDTVVDPLKSIEFCKKLGNCELRTYDGMYHELLNEEKRGLVFKDVKIILIRYLI